METGLASGRDIFQRFAREQMEDVANGADWLYGSVLSRIALLSSHASYF